MPSSLTRKLQKRKAIVAKIEHFYQELADLDRELFPRIETLAAAIDGGGHAVKVIKEARRKIVDVLVDREQKSLAYAAQRLLLEAKRPMRTIEIYEELVKRGIPVNGKVPQNNLAAHLSHYAKIFVNTSEGWQLHQDIQKTNAQAAH